MIYFHDYDASYDPAFPVVEVAISVLRDQEPILAVGDTFGGEATIGRDILNRYVVKLDGPAAVVEIL